MSDDRAHAILSPSSAERWLACPPSARINERYEDTTSHYAAEGTLAHSFGELFLKAALEPVVNAGIDNLLEPLRADALYYPGMEDEVMEYVDLVLATYNEALADDPAAEIFIEQKLDLTKYAPESFGTGDAVILTKDYVHVIDLKFGKGVAVEADDNPQLKLYGLGAYEEYGFIHDINEIRVTIAQVRLGSFLTFRAPAAEVIAWGESYVRPRAELAFAGEGEFEPGEHCRFCRHASVCKPRAEYYEAIYQKAMDSTLTNEEIAYYLTIAKDMVAWAKQVQDEALQNALSGQSFPGWKVVEGRSVRRVTDVPRAAEVLLAEGLTEQDIYRLAGITELEKLVGKTKFAAILAPYLEKPPGKPTLAPESDKRPAIDLISDGLEFDD